MLESSSLYRIIDINNRLAAVHDVTGIVDVLEKHVLPSLGVDGLGVAISSMFNPTELAWHTRRLPTRFLGPEYAAAQKNDVVLQAVLKMPGKFVTDERMADHEFLVRSDMCVWARECGMTIERAMSAMVLATPEMSVGVSYFRDKNVSFTPEAEAFADLTLASIREAARKCREFEKYGLVNVSLEMVLQHQGLACIYAHVNGREIGRTALATTLVEKYFDAHARSGGKLPTLFVDELKRRGSKKIWPKFEPGVGHVRGADGVLEVKWLQHSAGLWLILLEEILDESLPAEWKAELSPTHYEIMHRTLILQQPSKVIAMEMNNMSENTVKSVISRHRRKYGAEKTLGLLSMVHRKKVH